MSALGALRWHMNARGQLAGFSLGAQTQYGEQVIHGANRQHGGGGMGVCHPKPHSSMKFRGGHGQLWDQVIRDPAQVGHHFRGHFCGARGERTFDPKKPVTHLYIDREGVGWHTPLLPSPCCRISMLRSTWAREARGASHIGERCWAVSQAWPPVGKGAASCV